ncbi:MAG: hypothetical protein ACI8Y4_004052 [Candidatus Poriferisodalaceae bacterium]|jgi:hypothetical protein
MKAVRSFGRVILKAVLVVISLTAVGVVVLVIVDRRARDENEVRLVSVPFTTPGSDALTVGRIIFIHRDRSEDAGLLAHELVHVCQWEEQGIEFLWDYSTEYVENMTELRDHRAAYKEISFEEVARLGDIECQLDVYVEP